MQQWYNKHDLLLSLGRSELIVIRTYLSVISDCAFADEKTPYKDLDTKAGV
jgi:hypothetical protein